MYVNRLNLAWHSATQWIPEPNPDPLSGLRKVALIGMGVSANTKDDPDRQSGPSNEEVADILVELRYSALRQSIETHVLPQREVAEALEQKYPFVPLVCVLTETADEAHITGHDILGQAKAYAGGYGIAEAVVVGHWRHELRFVWDAENWGFRAVRLPHRFACAYAPESTQWWTHNGLTFLAWECLARSHLVLRTKWPRAEIQSRFAMSPR